MELEGTRIHIQLYSEQILTTTDASTVAVGTVLFFNRQMLFH
jgi:hypothetical protein